jgi:hypothetical protein
MAGAKAAATPFQKLAAAFDTAPRLESREGTTVEAFLLEREALVVEVALLHSTPPVLQLRAHEEEPAPASGYRQHVLARVRKRLIYAPLFFRRVSSLDRVNAVLGLRFEVRTGDKAFDRAVTVEGDVSDEVITHALADAEARAAVLEILTSGMNVRFDEHALCAELAAPADAHFGAAAVTPVVEALVKLVPRVPRADPSAFTKRPMPGRVITAAILVLGVIGAGALAPGTLDDPSVPVRSLPRPLLPLPFMVPGLLAGSGAFVVSYLLLRWQLKRRNTSTDLPLVLALFVVMAVLGVGLLDGANRLLDEAPLGVHEARVTGKDTLVSRKSGAVNEWYLVVPSWRPDAAQLELSIDADLHRGVRVGDTIRVTTHPGFFGWEWGAVVERASSSGSLAPAASGSLAPAASGSLAPASGSSSP